MLAGRLIAAQTPTGGWGYNTTNYTAAESATLLAALRRFSPPRGDPPPSPRARPGSLAAVHQEFGRHAGPAAPTIRCRAIAEGGDRFAAGQDEKAPGGARQESLILEDPKDKGSEPTTGSTDNSNTHFAILGLWAAETRCADGPLIRAAHSAVPDQSGRERNVGIPLRPWRSERPVANDVRGAPGAGDRPRAQSRRSGAAREGPEGRGAFAALSPRIGEPAGHFDDRPSIKDAGGLYFLWAIERIAVLYDVRQLDKKDWYRSGAGDPDRPPVAGWKLVGGWRLSRAKPAAQHGIRD